MIKYIVIVDKHNKKSFESWDDAKAWADVQAARKKVNSVIIFYVRSSDTHSYILK